MQQIIGFSDGAGYTWLTVNDGIITKAQTEQGEIIPVTIAHVHAVMYYTSVKEGSVDGRYN